LSIHQLDTQQAADNNRVEYTDLLFPPGKYHVILRDFQTALMFAGKQPKLIMTFVIERGEHQGKPIRAFYNAVRLFGRPQKGGRFKMGQKSDFYREFCGLFDHNGGNARLDRIPMSLFNGRVIEAKVRTVTKARGRELPEAAQYSVIDQLLRVVE